MLKKFASVLLCLILVICVVPMGAFTITASAAAKYTSGYYTYTVTNGNATITRCNTSISGDITIPSTLGSYPVTEIGYSAFQFCDSLTSVTIPDSVTSIGASVFLFCDSLSSINILDGVTSIDASAFQFCDSLISINVDDNNKNYSSQDGVLFDKDKTTLVCYPAGKTSTTYSIPNSVTRIGEGAFWDCISLTSITIPSSVTSIGDGAFYWCSFLTNINVDDNNKYYSSQDGVLFDKDKTTIIKYPANQSTTYSIPNGVTSIGVGAFRDCYLLTNVTIPNSVTSIGNYAFWYCLRLTSINIPSSVTNMGIDTFGLCSRLTSVTIGNSVTNIGERAFSECTSLTSVTIGNSVTGIGNSAFSSCSSLTCIIIPNSVNSVGEYVFYKCTSLSSITIPDSIANIGDGAFSSCSSLISITIPNSVISISNYAFSNCNNLTVNCYSDSYAYTYCCKKSIGYNLLDGHTHSYTSVVTAPTCDTNGYTTYTCGVCGHSYESDKISVTGEHSYTADVIFPTLEAQGYTKYFCIVCGDTYNDNYVDYVPTVPFSLVVQNGEITITGYTGEDNEVVIPAEIDGYKVTSVGQKAFYLNRKITSVTIPGTVKTIGESAFRGCSKLASVTFNEGLESIGTYAFGATALTKVVFPSTLKTIGVSAFNGLKTLTEIDLKNVQSIKGTAFANCTALGSTGAGNRVVVPATLTELGANAFLNCTSIIRVDWYPVKLTSGAAGSMEKPAFQGCTGINEVRIYETAENIPAYAFYKASDVANNKGITTLRFMAGSKAKTIGDYAFYQQRIGKITFPNTITKIGVESFRNNNLLKVLTFGTGDMTIGQLAFSFCNNLPSVTIPGNVKTVYAYAFRGCSKLETVVVEEGVEYISSYAFGFTGLKSITLPASITKINSGLTYPTAATINYPAGSYVDKYLHSSAARITNETLVPIA